MNKLSYKILVAVNNANKSNTHIDLSVLLLKFRSRKYSATDIDVAVEDLCNAKMLINHDNLYDAHVGLEVTASGRYAMHLHETANAASTRSTIALILSSIATVTSVAAFITTLL